MLTMDCMFQMNYPIDHVLTKYDKAELIQENKDKDYSYLCLLKEMLSYNHITINDLFNGWSGIKLFNMATREINSGFNIGDKDNVRPQWN